MACQPVDLTRKVEPSWREVQLRRDLAVVQASSAALDEVRRGLNVVTEASDEAEALLAEVGDRVSDPTTIEDLHGLVAAVPELWAETTTLDGIDDLPVATAQTAWEEEQAVAAAASQTAGSGGGCRRAARAHRRARHRRPVAGLGRPAVAGRPRRRRCTRRSTQAVCRRPRTARGG